MNFHKSKKKLVFHSVLGWSRRCGPPPHSSNIKEPRPINFLTRNSHCYTISGNGLVPNTDKYQKENELNIKSENAELQVPLNQTKPETELEDAINDNYLQVKVVGKFFWGKFFFIDRFENNTISSNSITINHRPSQLIVFFHHQPQYDPLLMFNQPTKKIRSQTGL